MMMMMMMIVVYGCAAVCTIREQSDLNSVSCCITNQNSTHTFPLILHQTFPCDPHVTVLITRVTSLHILDIVICLIYIDIRVDQVL